MKITAHDFAEKKGITAGRVFKRIAQYEILPVGTVRGRGTKCRYLYEESQLSAIKFRKTQK